MDRKNISWVNNAKALCMIAVYYIHSQVYYGNGSVGELVAYSIYPFYVNLFFFVSGFLFLSKVSSSTLWNSREWGRRTLGSVLYKLVIPTILFSTLIYVPKLMFHSRDISFGRYLFDVFGGVSFWFTSALALLQIFFVIITCLGVRSQYVFLAFGLAAFVGGNILENVTISPFPWHYKSAMCASLFFAIGGCYKNSEHKIERLGRWRLVFVFLYLGLILTTFRFKDTFMFGSMGVGYNLPGTMICLLAIVAFLYISEIIGLSSVLEFIGRKSIVFYFFSGVMPAFWGTIALKFFLCINDMLTFVVTIAALLSAAGITWFIDRYMPWLLDLRILINRR